MRDGSGVSQFFAPAIPLCHRGPLFSEAVPWSGGRVLPTVLLKGREGWFLHSDVCPPPNTEMNLLTHFCFLIMMGIQ